MLVLSRKPGERIVMPEVGVTVTVLAVRGNQVRLGIAAPPGIPVHRSEILLRIQDDGGARAAGAARTP